MEAKPKIIFSNLSIDIESLFTCQRVKLEFLEVLTLEGPISIAQSLSACHDRKQTLLE